MRSGAGGIEVGARWKKAGLVLAMAGLVTAAQADDAATASTTTLGAVVVQGAATVDAGYSAHDGSAGTKTDTPLQETPQSVTVVTREQLEDQGTQGLSSTLRYVAGVAAEAQGFQPSRDWSIAIRGFDATTYGLYHNGMFWDPNAQTDAYELDRVEILKGPSSVLYGLNAPGGLINMVTKHPVMEALHELEADYGSYDRKQLKGDFGGPVDGSSHWYYRMVALYRDSDTQVDHLPDDRILFAPSLMWKPDENTSLTLLADFQRDNGSWIQFLPASGTLLPNPNGRLSTSLDLGEPGSDHMHRRQFSLGYEFVHRFNDNWSVHQNFRAAHDNTNLLFTYYNTYGNTVDSAGYVPGSGERQINRALFDYLPRDTTITLDTQLRGHFNNGWLEQTVLVGVDALRYYTDIYSSCCEAASSLDVFNPVYGSSGALSDFGHNASAMEQIGIYAQDQLKLDQHWVAVLGGRQDFVRNVTFGYGAAEDREYDHKFSGRAGLLYLTDFGLAPYASFSQSFVPTTGINAYTGERLKPTTGTQYEAGLKYEPVGGRVSATLSAFSITQSNIASTDPANPLNTVQVGEERSRGVELEVHGRVYKGLQLIGSYSYNPVKITQSTTPGQVGIHPAQVPTRLASLWADYTLPRLGPGEFGAGFGVRRTGSSFGDSDDTPGMTVPGYTLLDGLLRYDWSHWRFAVNGSNLTDKTYVAACNGFDNCYYGYRRSVIGSVRYAW